MVAVYLDLYMQLSSSCQWNIHKTPSSQQILVRTSRDGGVGESAGGDSLSSLGVK